MSSKLQTALIGPVLPAILGNLVLWLLAGSHISLLSFAVSSSLLTAAWISLRNWVSRKEDVFPLFCAVCGMYWLYFALPLYLGSDSVLMYQFVDVQLGDSALQTSLSLVGFGVFFTWLGISSRVGRFLFPRSYLDLAEGALAWDWTRTILFGLRNNFSVIFF